MPFFNGKFLIVVVTTIQSENNNFIDLLTAVVAVDHDKCLVFWLCYNDDHVCVVKETNIFLIGDYYTYYYFISAIIF